MKVMLLAAGRGERMRPLTDHTPKPLLQAGGKPLIVWHIENLVSVGICDLVINHAHLGNQIEAALGDGSSLGARILYSPENPALETAGGIANALPLLCEPSPSIPLGEITSHSTRLQKTAAKSLVIPLAGEGSYFPSSASGRGARGESGGIEEPFAVINSDIYCKYDLAQLPLHAAALQASGDAAHLVLVNNPDHHPNGDFSLHNGRVADSQPRLTFSGIGLYRPSLFTHIPRGRTAPLAPLLRAQMAQHKVSGELYSGRWVDVGTPQRLQQLDKALRQPHNTHHA